MTLLNVNVTVKIYGTDTVETRNHRVGYSDHNCQWNLIITHRTYCVIMAFSGHRNENGIKHYWRYEPEMILKC